MPDFNAMLLSLVHQGAGYYPLLDRAFIVLTTIVTSGVLALVLLSVCIRPFVTKDPRARLERIGAAIEVSVSLFCTWFIVSALKVLVALPRPFVSLTDIVPLVGAAPYESFPSAHAALTMAAALAVFPYQRHLGHVLMAFSLVIGLSRLFVGVHYPFDVGVGLLIGYLVSKFVHRAFQRRTAYNA